MSMPDVKTILIIVMFNILMFTVSYSLSSFFGTSGDAVPTFTIPTAPTYTWTDLTSVLTSMTDTISYVLDWFGFLFTVLTFDIDGLPDTVRMFISIPIVLANSYVILMVIMGVLDLIGNYIPFT